MRVIFESYKEKKSKQEKNYIQKIQEGYVQERQKEDYFVPSKIPTQFIEKEKKSNIFALNFSENGYESSLNIEELSKEYKGISIDKLKFIYSRLTDFNLCKTFLDRYYSEKKVLPQKIQQPKPKVQKQKVNDSNNQKKISMSEKVSKIDPQYKNVAYDDVRDELDHLFKRRQLFRMTRGKIQNTAHRKQLERLACQDDPKIRKLSEISRLKLLEEMIEGHPQDLDLHGYRQEQIDDLFYYIQKMIKQEYKNGNSLIKTKKMGSQVFIMVKAITGKGLHSKYGKSILKPAISSWCERNGLQKAINEQSVDVYFQV